MGFLCIWRVVGEKYIINILLEYYYSIIPCDSSWSLLEQKINSYHTITI